MIILRQREFSKMGDWIKGNTDSDRTRIKKIFHKIYDKNKEYYHDQLKYVDPDDEDRVNVLLDKLKKSKKDSKDAAKLINKAGKMAMIALPTTAIIGTGAAIIKNNIDKKKSNENKETSKKEHLTKLGQETDKDIREAVKGTKAESKVDKILKKSEKEMKKAAQKEYAAISDEGRVAMKSKDALEKARELGYTKKDAVKAAKRFLDKAREDINSQERFIRETNNSNRRELRTRIGFIKDTIGGKDWKEEKFGRVMIGFHPNQIEPSGQKVKLGFKKFSLNKEEKIKDFNNMVIRHSPRSTENSLKQRIEELKKDNNKNNVKLGFKKFSKQDREIVPADIVKKVKDGGGVIQKDHNGDWRIISMKSKTNKSGKPEFWPQKSKDREDMVKILQSYQANKHK